jgi:ribosomal protein L16 Arg81 hydroxylase
MATVDFHVRWDSKLDTQIEREALLRRTSKNQLITGIVQRALNPNPDDEATIFKRLDQVQKALITLESAVKTLTHHYQLVHKETTAVHEKTEQALRQGANQARETHLEIVTVRDTVRQEMRGLLQNQATRHEKFLRDLIAYAANESRGFLRKVGESLAASVNGRHDG